MGVDAVDAGNRLKDRYPELVPDTEQLSVAHDGDTIIDIDKFWMYFTMHPSTRVNLRAGKTVL